MLVWRVFWVRRRPGQGLLCCGWALALLACLLVGCSLATPPEATSTRVPTSTQVVLTPAPTSAQVVTVRPGVYVADEIAALPLPASGYSLYVIGETHGQREVHELALTYLAILHGTVGLRDVALELSQYYEEVVNEYVNGVGNSLPDPEYWGYFGMDILDGIRTFNAMLPDEERVRVHLVDIDVLAPMLHAHLQALKEELGAAAEQVDVPSLVEFEGLSQEEMLVLVDRFLEVAQGKAAILAELENLRYSVQNYFLMASATGWEQVANERSAIREAAIAQTMGFKVDELDGAPMLVLFGAWHTQKHIGMQVILGPAQYVEITEQPWAQRLHELGMRIYTVYAGGLSGSMRFRGGERRVELDADQFYFPDGNSLAAVLESAPECEVVYIDLGEEANAAARFGEGFDSLGARFDPDVPAGDIYDGLILFQQVTPAQ